MKRLFYLLATGMLGWLLISSCKKDHNDDADPDDVIETQPNILKPVITDVGSNIGGYYEALPSRYYQTSKSYPMLIYLHGSGQLGNGNSELGKVLEHGTARVLSDKRFPPNFVMNGQDFSFVVLMPQFKSAPSNVDIKAFVDYAKANYRYDPSRVYLSGSSMGARAVAEFTATYPTEEAAIVPMAGALFYELGKKAKNIADNRVAVWGFHNDDDEVISVGESRNFVTAINSFSPAVPARITIFPESDSPQKHDAWTIPTDPSYRENGLNIYEWMLQYKR